MIDDRIGLLCVEVLAKALFLAVFLQSKKEKKTYQKST